MELSEYTYKYKVCGYGYVCIVFTLNLSFLPNISTPIVHADSSQRDTWYKVCGHRLRQRKPIGDIIFIGWT